MRWQERTESTYTYQVRVCFALPGRRLGNTVSHCSVLSARSWSLTVRQSYESRRGDGQSARDTAGREKQLTARDLVDDDELEEDSGEVSCTFGMEGCWERHGRWLTGYARRIGL